MGKDAPKSPDPYKVADAQYKMNQKTAQENQRLGMTGQDSPYGSLNWVADPTSPSGYRAVTSLTPEQQAIFSQHQGLQGTAMSAIERAMSQPFDLNAARGTEISDMQRTFLDPQWNQRAESLEADLLNRGIRQGSEAYDREMTRFNNQRSSAYDQMYLDAWQTANNAALQERQLPFSDMASVFGVQPVSMPQFVNTPQSSMNAPNLSDMIYQDYAQKMDQHNAGMGGLFGMGGKLLGGWASAGFPGLSDKRAKKDIERIGTDPRGWGVYKFRYKGAAETDDTWQLGFMAQEVEDFRPDAVITSPSTGIKFVDYDRLAVQ